MAAKCEEGIINSSQVNKNSFPEELPLTSSSSIAYDHVEKAVEVQS